MSFLKSFNFNIFFFLIYGEQSAGLLYFAFYITTMLSLYITQVNKKKIGRYHRLLLKHDLHRLTRALFLSTPRHIVAVVTINNINTNKNM